MPEVISKSKSLVNPEVLRRARLARQDRLNPISETSDYSKAQKSVGSCPPGWMLVDVVPLKPLETASGIILPSSDPKKNGDAVVYGVVVQCGGYLNHQGNEISSTAFPLVPGTIVEFQRQYPWQTAELRGLIHTADVTRYWQPGTRPEFWPDTVKMEIIYESAKG